MSINVVSSSIRAAKLQPYQALQVDEAAPTALTELKRQPLQDQVVVSERARSLASSITGEKEAPLQLSFPKLRELVTPPELADAPGM